MRAPLAIVVALAALAAAASFASPAAAAAAAPTTCANAERIPEGETQRREAMRTIRCLVNIERKKVGAVALLSSSQLARVAQRQSTDMVRHQYVGHVNSAGEHLRKRVARVGYPRLYTGEAVLWGTGTQRSPAGLVRKLMTTPAHKAIMLAARFRELGIGLVLRPPLAGRPNGATLTMTVGRRR